MRHIATYSTVAKLPMEQAWSKLKNLSLASQYVPGITKCIITTAKEEGIGASRRVSGSQHVLDETVTEWQEGCGLTLRLHNGDRSAFPFSEAFFSYRIDPADSDSCKLTCTMSYSMLWGYFGNALHKMLLTKLIGARIRDVTLSMAYLYETGHRPAKRDLK